MMQCKERASSCGASGCYKTSCVLFKNSFRRINSSLMLGRNRSYNFSVKACSFAVLLLRYILLPLRLEAVLCTIYKNKVGRKEHLILSSRILHHLTCVEIILLLGNIKALFSIIYSKPVCAFKTLQ